MQLGWNRNPDGTTEPQGFYAVFFGAGCFMVFCNWFFWGLYGAWISCWQFFVINYLGLSSMGISGSCMFMFLLVDLGFQKPPCLVECWIKCCYIMGNQILWDSSLDLQKAIHLFKSDSKSWTTGFWRWHGDFDCLLMIQQAPVIATAPFVQLMHWGQVLTRYGLGMRRCCADALGTPGTPEGRSWEAQISAARFGWWWRGWMMNENI